VPRVWPLISQVAFHPQVSGIVFNIADVSEGFHGSCLDHVSFQAHLLTLSRLSASFLGLTSSFTSGRQSHAVVLMRSSNRLPSGNCDLPGLETFPGFLTRLGTVSNRSWPLSPFFALADGASAASTDSARTPPEELVNTASSATPFGAALRGAEPTSLTQPFPSYLGLSSELSTPIC